MAEMEASSTSADTASSVYSSLSARRLDKDVLDVLKDLQLNQKELIPFHSLKLLILLRGLR
jgi:hypothetical protein